MTDPVAATRRPLSSISAAVIAASFLAGCGGGGETSVDVSRYLPAFAAPAPVAIGVLSRGFTIGPTVVADTAALLASPKYQNTRVTIGWLRSVVGDSSLSGTLYALRSSGAAFAHAAGLTGAGQIIAISDENISATHESIAGRVTVLSNDPAGDDHGTAVASVAAGNAAGFVGVAPDATMLFGTWSDAALAEIGQAALAQGAVAWNNSWGYPTLRPTQSNFNSVFGSLSGQSYLAALDAYAAQGVVVFAVDNTSRSNATLMDALPWVRPSLEAGWLAVANGVPTFASGAITSVSLVSNACWEAARWCLVADGSWNAASDGTSGYDYTTGSSFAAPQVAGALALLAEAFPDLTPHQLRIRLLASAADDFFTPDGWVELAEGFSKGYSVTYGHGFLDIEAALRPIGQTTMSLSDGGRISTAMPALRTGTAFGDAVEVGLSGTNVAVRDALAAGFVMPAGALTAGARPGAQAGRLLADTLQGDLVAERMAAGGAIRATFAALPGPVATLAAPDGRAFAAILLPQEGSGAAGLAVSRALTDGAFRIDLGLKLARDNGGVMSLNARESAAMAAVTLGLSQDLGDGAFVSLSGEMGITDLGGSTAFGDTGSARFDAVKLTLGKSGIFARDDRLTLGVGLPVAISSGRTELDLPVVRSRAAAGFESVTLDLAPENRQLDLELTYQTALSKRLEMKLSLIHSDNFGNRAGVRDTSGALGFAFRF